MKHVCTPIVLAGPRPKIGPPTRKHSNTSAEYYLARKEVRKMSRVAVRLLLALIGIVLLASAAHAASLIGFGDATFASLTLGPSLANGQLNYDLSLGTGATITFGAATYNVDWIQAFYVTAAKDQYGFEAAGSDQSENWRWDLKPALETQGLALAGWKTTGQHRILPGQTKSFTFASLVIDPTKVLPGFHIQYTGNGVTRTDWFRRPTKLSVPEPSTAQAGLGILVGMLSPAVRRLRGKRT